MKTINLRLPRARWFELQPPAAAALAIFFLLLLGLIVGRVRSTPSVLLQPTPALDAIIIIASPLPQGPVPTPAAVVAVQLPRFVVCYDQPVKGAVLGPIPAPDASAIVARYGNDWVMTPWNGGYCWLRAADVGLPDVADLAPTPAPQVVYIASQPEAAPTPAPEQYEVASEPPAIPTAAPVVARKEDFQAPSRSATCAFTGCMHP